MFALLYWPRCPGWLRSSLAAAFVLVTVFCFRRAPQKWKWTTLAVAFLLLRFCWSFIHPSNDRDWVDYNARLPTADFSGEQVTIHNVRSTTWRSVTDYDLRWEDRTYDLRRLRTVDFVIAPFALNGALAHTFLTFGFEDGEHLAISVEVRKEKGETFEAVGGLFRHFEIACFIGDETDIIGLRTAVQKDPVYLFPVRATEQQVRELFELMLRDASQLAREPEFYNSLVNTCHLRILHHVNTRREHKIGFNWRNVFPGRSDELAWDLGLIRFDGTLEEARRRFLINDRSQLIPDHKQWSRQIRALPEQN